MRRWLSSLLACSLLVLLAGCGSSSSSTSGTGTTGTVTIAAGASAPAGTGTTAGKGKTASTGKTSGSDTTPRKTSSPGGELKVDGKPKFGSPPASAPVQSGLVQIAYRNIAIEPDTLKVKVGSTIRWTNYDPVKHNVTSEGGPQTFASGNFGEDGTFEITVTKAGVIHYENTLQPVTMNGTIEVVK